MKGLILAAGLGTRLRPITSLRPKPTINVANKPLIHYAVENLREAGVDTIGVVVGILNNTFGCAIMADAAYALLATPSRELTGQFLIDSESNLRAAGERVQAPTTPAPAPPRWRPRTSSRPPPGWSTRGAGTARTGCPENSGSPVAASPAATAAAPT